jgi:RNA polymerase sigma-70 factor, ECF subfamily
VSGGDQQSLDSLLPVVYQELRRLAAAYIRNEKPGQTLQPTALVHEAYSMRQILIERARARNAQKRWGDKARVTLDEALVHGGEQSVDLLALDSALERLAALDPEQARIVELRFFGGLTVEETADALGVSPATVKRHWTVARAWLARELANRPDA